MTDNNKTCDHCCYDILDDEGDVVEHECIEDTDEDCTPYSQWSAEDKARHWHREVDDCCLDAAIDGLFGEIHEQMKKAGVPDELWDDVFTLVNNDYTITYSRYQ